MTYVIFETTSHFSRHNSEFFLAQTLYTFYKSSHPIKVQILRLSTACMKIKQIPYVIYKARVTFSLYFASPFSVMKYNFSPFSVMKYNFSGIFQLKHFMLLTKRAHQCTSFSTLSALMKVHPIPHAIFETTWSGLIQILYHIQCHERYLLYFFVL